MALVKRIYRDSWAQREALCGPYASVIDIDFERLPDPGNFAEWSFEEVTSALRHDPACPAYDRNIRQLLHVGFKIAAKLGDEYLRALDEYEPLIARNVTGNILKRHIEPIWGNQLTYPGRNV